MCLAVPGKIIALDGTNAVIDIMGAQRTVAVDLIRDIQVGDYLMVHAGYAIGKVDVEEAERSLELLRELGMLMSEEQDSE